MQGRPRRLTLKQAPQSAGSPVQPQPCRPQGHPWGGGQGGKGMAAEHQRADVSLVHCYNLPAWPLG